MQLRIDARTKDLQARTLSKIIPTTNDSVRSYRRACKSTVHPPASTVYKEVKYTVVQALRFCTGRTVHRGSRGIAVLFLDHGTSRGEGPGPLFTRGKDPVPIVQEVGRAPGPVWTGAENLASSPGFDSRTVQPVANRYTNWATRPTVQYTRTHQIPCEILLWFIYIWLYHRLMPMMLIEEANIHRILKENAEALVAATGEIWLKCW